jgi:flagellar biosynthesis/type III secretory pathway protein FliH
MVGARKESYYAGVKVGFDEGYSVGYSQKCTEIHRYYKQIIKALELKTEVEKCKSYEQGMRDGFEKAREGWGNGRTQDVRKDNNR